MGTYVSHLRNAEILSPQIGDLDQEAFVLGNLAPDSGIPNDDWTQTALSLFPAERLQPYEPPLGDP